MNLAVDGFVAALRGMSPGSIKSAASMIRRQGDGADAEWLTVTVGIERAVRVYRRPVEAAMAARAAREAVIVAAEQGGLEGGLVSEEDVQTVSRRAGEVARALVVGSSVTPSLSWLTRGWTVYAGYQVPLPWAFPAAV